MLVVFFDAETYDRFKDVVNFAQSVLHKVCSNVPMEHFFAACTQPSQRNTAGDVIATRRAANIESTCLRTPLMLATRRRLVVSKLVKSHDFVRRRAPCLALPLVCCASTHAPELVYVVVWRGGGGVVVVVKQGLQRKVGVVVG